MGSKTIRNRKKIKKLNHTHTQKHKHTKNTIKKTRSKTKKLIKGGKGKGKVEPTNLNAQTAILNHNNEIHGDDHIISKDDKTFNENPYIRESHNCYTYFLNMKSQSAVDLCKQDYKHYNMCRRAQPGYISGHKTLNKKDYNCPIIKQRTLDDNPYIYEIDNINVDCKPEYYKGALVVAPNRDYHYYRQDDDSYGYWSHKPGYKPSTMRDSDGNLIRNPQKAARKYTNGLNYTDFCGYFCVPRNTKKKFMAHKGEKVNFDNRKLTEIALEKYEKNKGKIQPKYKENMDAIYQDLAKQVKNKIISNSQNSV